MDGILNIHKPYGETSFKIVQVVKQLTAERRVGHAGTLDPLATGVLPICIGKGTRVVEYLMEATKIYRAEIELGVVTDTYDADGTVTSVKDPSAINQDQLQSALNSFCGLIQQTPPMYSALKSHGQPLYKLARSGITVERKSRSIQIHKIDLINWQSPVITVEVVCSKGTYIRSLAYDLGNVLGCGAYLKNLVRLGYGLFNIEDAILLSQLQDACRYGYWRELIYPVDSVLMYWNAVIVGDDVREKISHGRPVTFENDDNKQQISPRDSFGYRCRVYALDGCFIGVLRFNSESQEWLPEKIFNQSS